jgi:hypothetical protein
VGALLSLGRFSYANLLLVFTKLHIRLTHSLRRISRWLRLSHRFGFNSSSPEVYSPKADAVFFGAGTSGRRLGKALGLSRRDLPT